MGTQPIEGHSGDTTEFGKSIISSCRLLRRNGVAPTAILPFTPENPCVVAPILIEVIYCDESAASANGCRDFKCLISLKSKR